MKEREREREREREGCARSTSFFYRCEVRVISNGCCEGIVECEFEKK